MPTPFEISARAVHQAAVILLSAHQQDGLPWRELWPLVREADPDLEREWQQAAPNATTGLDTNLSHNGTNLVKAGWLRRTGRRWRLTGLGARAVADYPDPMDFFSEAINGYLAWRTDRPAFDAAAALLSELPDGRWVRISELATEYELDADALAACFQGTRPNGWHLALGYDGDVWPELPLLPVERDEWRWTGSGAPRSCRCSPSTTGATALTSPGGTASRRSVTTSASTPLHERRAPRPAEGERQLDAVDPDPRTGRNPQ